jgi:hypothetical protein
MSVTRMLARRVPLAAVFLPGAIRVPVEAYVSSGFLLKTPE